MTDRIRKLRDFYLKKEHHKFRRIINYEDGSLTYNQETSGTAVLGVNASEREENRRGYDYSAFVTRAAANLSLVLKLEKPVVFPEEKIAFMRTVSNLPPAVTEQEKYEMERMGFYFHEAGRVCNICPDYAATIKSGLEARRKECEEALPGGTKEEKVFLKAVITAIDAVYDLTDRYRTEAERAGNETVAESLKHIPRQGASTFLEALQMFRILHYTLWAEGEYHNTIGRFDQYIYPYYKKDLEEGIITREEAFELMEEFFITFNKDSDLYMGVQQGDNGQSMMLGGCNASGECCFNEVSEMCLEASRELMLIDPKINLRVNKNTPLEVYKTGTRLTKAGLGFPQYSNDDVVIPGLTALGYDYEDALNYTVAACWEFIIPGAGMDIPNIDAVNFPAIVEKAVKEDIDNCDSYEAFFHKVRERVFIHTQKMLEEKKNLVMIPAPFMSLLMDSCIKSRKDISLGNKYNNYGFHGVGIAAAVDSLAAIKKYVYEENSVSKEVLQALISLNSMEAQSVFHKLRYETEKFGDNDPWVNEIAEEILNTFADALLPLKNERNGIVRAGTGSAMYYIWHGAKTGNTAGGHKKGEAFGANYSPDLYVKSKGPLSVIQAFANRALKRVINGGPLTMEFHSLIFEEEAGIENVANLVKFFIASGGHQLQLNAVNLETMKAAKQHPENYANLIVRIWGWSAYFVELDEEYQNHVIARQEYLNI